MAETRTEAEVMWGTALAGAEVIKAAMEIPLEDLKRYAQHAREHASRNQAISPILHHHHGSIAVAEQLRADEGAARAATALCEFRRVLEDVRAR